MKPKLSLIICARNDGYMGNFKWRFETVLNYLADNLKKLGRLMDVEVIVTDWASEVPLYRVLALNWSAKQIVRFVLVPPEVACKLQADSEFPIVLAQNAAVRRSRGEYIAQTDSDILLPPEFLKVLFEVLDGHRSIGVPIGEALIVAKRRHLPWSYASKSPSIQELDWFIRHFKYFLLMDISKEFGPIAATGMMMMHRHLWQECRGYDESLIHWGWMEVDLGLRLTRKYPCFDLSNLGVSVFHLEHYHPLSRRNPNRKFNTGILNDVLSANSEKWGLSEYDLEIFAYPEDTHKEFPSRLEKQQAVQLNPVLLVTILQVFFSKIRILRRLITYTVFVYHKLRCTPVPRWPDLIKDLWLERQRKF